jgi:hypothetical protein
MKRNDKLLLLKSLALTSLIAIISYSCMRKNCTVWVASPWQQVMRSTPPGDLQTVTIKAAANEYEPFRLIIHNSGNAPLKDLNVKISSLKSSLDGISSGNIRLFRANYVHIAKPSPDTKNLAGWYPDALIPFSGSGYETENGDVTFVAEPFSVDTAQNAEVWCDLFVPRGTKPGIYTGFATVTIGKSNIAEIPVNLTVWDFELPEKIAMLSYFGSMHESAVKLMGLESGSEQFLKMEMLYEKELLKNRAVPSTPDNVWPQWNEKEGIIEKGETERIKRLVEEDHFNALDIPFRYKNEPKKCKAYLKATADWLRKLGYLNMSYIYLEDEPNDARQYNMVREQGALIKSADPEIGRLCTEQTITSNPAWGTLYGAVDIWCPLWGLWDEPTANERLSKGEKLWSYTALRQGAVGTPWWEIDMDPVNFRTPSWISWKYNITGFLYWASVYWGDNKTLQSVWENPVYNKDFWGEGVLLYPGKPAGIKGFVPSIRLKLYREAEEDFEYMTLAAGLGKKTDVDNIVKDIASSFQNWSRDIKAYEQAREKLADLILKNK